MCCNFIKLQWKAPPNSRTCIAVELLQNIHWLVEPAPLLACYSDLFTGEGFTPCESEIVAMTSCSRIKCRVVERSQVDDKSSIGKFSFPSGTAFMPSLWRHSMEASLVAEIVATPLPS